MAKKTWEYVGDVNPEYGGKWIRHVGGRRYHVVELVDMDDACGRDNVGRDRFVVDLSEVDLDVADLKAARDFYGIPKGEEVQDTYLVEAVHSYGEKAPLGEWSGKRGWTRPVREAKRESRALESDPDAYEAKMDRPVNAIGSTAREFQRGDIHSAIERGVLEGNPSARLLAKMGGVDQPVIDDARPADWMPYFMGYQDGIAGRPKETHEDLAPEYHQGFARGERVRKGEAPAPGWIKSSGAGFRPVQP